MKKKNTVTLLDCTMRDGGYYNQWDFSLNVARNYIQAISDAGIDVVEIGFRFFPEDHFRGAFAYSSDDLIALLEIPARLKIAVMCNGSQFLGSAEPQSMLVRRLFSNQKDSCVNLVRIAINFDRALETRPLLDALKENGYDVALNLMQSSGKENSEYSKTALALSKWGMVDVLYFADSLGDMSPIEAKRVTKNILKEWDGPLGFHPHNNRGQAFINMFAAIEAGVSWGDSTIRGMGRGAGNLQTEIFLAELSDRGKHGGDISPLEDILDTFDQLQAKHGWGPSLYYHLSANWGIHPTFVQEILQDRRSGRTRVVPILKKLKNMKARSYSVTVLEDAITSQVGGDDFTGSWDASGWLSGRDVLLVAGGPSVRKYLEGVRLFIASHNPAVLLINTSDHFDSKIVDAVIVSNATSVILESSVYSGLKCPVITPIERIKSVLSNTIDAELILDYGLTVREQSFSISKTGCELGWDLSAAYALAVITQAEASKIYLVGFDGHHENNEKHEEMCDVLTQYQERYPDIPLVALTPTTYPVKQSSIYER